MSKIKAPAGAWPSPISAEATTQDRVQLGDVVVDGTDLYWTELRFNESGRYVIVKQDKDGNITDNLLPKNFNARTRVHEYGGAPYTVHNGNIYFTNFDDQLLYRLTPGEEPVALTQQGYRFADIKWTPKGLVAVGEDHTDKDNVQNFIALINPLLGEMRKLATGKDFYSSPTVSADGNKIAWISWKHPNMPFNNTELWYGDLGTTRIRNKKQVDANHHNQAFLQPQWDKNNKLYVISDKDNWWNLYQVNRQNLGKKIVDVQSEIGGPAWWFGYADWQFYKKGIVCSYEEQGQRRIKHIIKGENHDISPNVAMYHNYSQMRIIGDEIAVIAGGPLTPHELIRVNPANNEYSVVKASMIHTIDSDNLSQPEHITFPTTDEDEAHAFYYPPKNKQYECQEGEKPPVVVMSHGGPTANCGANFNAEIQYWTSRGYAVVDVNYRGSTGYGRAYREKLNGKWGVYDIDDCIACVKHLGEQGAVDAKRACITGGSAGGYTTLAALAFRQAFAAGASHYGISDLKALCDDTHKFESHYLPGLLGGTYEETPDIYDARSPIKHVNNFNVPIILFQGSEDKIVPPNQAEMIYNAVKEKGIASEYVLFNGEQHGFRDAKNRQTALTKQLAFFNTALGIKPLLADTCTKEDVVKAAISQPKSRSVLSFFGSLFSRKSPTPASVSESDALKTGAANSSQADKTDSNRQKVKM